MYVPKSICRGIHHRFGIAKYPFFISKPFFETFTPSKKSTATRPEASFLAQAVVTPMSSHRGNTNVKEQ